jgi:hypothetical protein
MLLFRKAGQSPIPAPTNYMIKSEAKKYLKDYGPSVLNISKMGYALHEIFGLIWAEIGVRSREEAGSWKNIERRVVSND